MFVNLLIIASIFGRGDLFFNQIILGLIVVVQVYETLYFVSRTNRDLSKFILAIQEADFTASFTGGPKDKSFDRLHDSFKGILETIRTSELEKEAQNRYLQMVVDNVNVGIISMDSSGKIELMNKKSQELLRVAYVRSWQLLRSESTAFFEAVGGLRSEENKLIEVMVDGSLKQLTVNVTEVGVLNKQYRIITFKDIKSELEKKEIEAWHKLIRILTHEIMNSVTPMSSLTETMISMLTKSDQKVKTTDDLDNETIEDLSFSLNTIHGRSEGLLHFVEDYRKLTKVPTPVIESISLQTLISGVVKLMQTQINEKSIHLRLDISHDELAADANLVEQVLINLLINAIHAVEETHDPQVKIVSEKGGNSLKLKISDNGVGIDEDKMDKIFVPFFSTKESGSGIGLSLCQQIMNLHGGTIEVQSVKGEGTTFTLVFPA